MRNFGKLWAGDESSFDIAMTAAVKALSLAETGKEPPQSDLLSVTDGVGVLTIEGPLIPGAAGFMSYFGITGYDDIRSAAVEAALNPDIKSLLLVISSPGGSVEGCEDCAAFISRINDQVMPVVAFSDGTMCSAAYWIGSAAEAVLVGPTSLTGSIGVIARTSEMSKMRESLGITDTTIRSVDHKQLVNSVEPLTPAGKEDLQTMVDDIHAVFEARVKQKRGNLSQKQLGQGRSYVGQKAVAAGLADGLSTYEGAIAAAKALQPVDNISPARQNTRHSTGADMKKTLSAEQIAAIASGAVIEASDAQAEAETTADEAATAAAAAAEAAKGTDAAATALATQAAADAAATAAIAAAAATTATTNATQAESELVKFLRTTLAETHETVTAKEVELVGLRAEAVTSRETQPKLLEIARSAVGKMKVALGGTASAAATMSAAEVITAHAETSELFLSKFKVGGAASTSAADAAGKDKVKAAESGPKVHQLFNAIAKSATK